MSSTACIVVGIIPARAGFTPCSPSAPEPHSDHPRSRGVYDDSGRAAADEQGSSPLARGLQGPARVARLLVRIIPARAGFTCPCPAPSTWVWDHPRSRGVYSAWPSGPSAGRGSSPLARGLRARPGPHRQGRRIIPARAGFTTCTPRGVSTGADHPRSRGVYGPGGFGLRGFEGSSPLARGLQRSAIARGLCMRIIPARAGFTSVHQEGQDRDRDHPRSRGVYRADEPVRHRPVGSSPLARGLRGGGRRPESRYRIIPARAGFTHRARPPRPPNQDHPRSRGVYPSNSPHG